jgi:leucyl aminopeptidase (aminopeptidase T)
MKTERTGSDKKVAASVVPDQKFTQEEIEQRMKDRADEYQKKVIELEKSQIVTGETMRLQFDGPGECGIGNTQAKPEVAPQDSPELPVDPNSFEAIEARLSKRAKELNDRDKVFEESQKVTQKTIDLEFDAPGGRLWRLNHPDD